MTGRNRVILIAGVALAALLVVAVTVSVVGGDGSGGGSGGGGEVGQNPPEPASPPANMTGDWGFRVDFEPDDRDYTVPERAVFFRLALYQDGNGYLHADEEGPGWMEGEEDQRYEVALRTGEGSVVRPDGAAGLIIAGDGYDYDDHYSFELDGDLNEDRTRVEGDAEGRIYIELPDTGDSVSGYATGFEAWRDEF